MKGAHPPGGRQHEDPHPFFAAAKQDGDACRAGDEIAEVAASARVLLIGERTALNFLQRLSGIATRAHRFVEAAGGRITILDTRKTTPTLRVLEKRAAIEEEAGRCCPFCRSCGPACSQHPPNVDVDTYTLAPDYIVPDRDARFPAAAGNSSVNP